MVKVKKLFNSSPSLKKKLNKTSLSEVKKNKRKNIVNKAKKGKIQEALTPKIKKAVEDEVTFTPRLNTKPIQDKFNIKIEDVETAINGVIQFRTKNPKLESQLFEDRAPLFLQISCLKQHKGLPQILRPSLPHSLLTPSDEICIIVPDVKGIKNKEHEKHIEHYEELFRKKNVTNIKKIMTFHELRTEYETFEQKNRLVDLYDVFLADGRISGKVLQKCGKPFYKKRKVPTAVKLQVTKLREHLEKSLSKTFLFLHMKGDSFTVQFGHDKMDTRKMVENVFSIVEFLNNNFPGGFANIKGLQVNAHRATSIPIYASFKSPNDVKVPEVKPKKPTAYKTYTDELTTLDNAKVTVKPTGEVLVQRIETGGNKDESILITDEDIIMANKIIKDNVKESEKKKKSRKRKQKGGIFEETPEKKQKIGKENTKSIAVNINKYKKNLKNTDQQKHDKNTKKAIMTGARPIKDKGKNGIELKRENSKTENANMAVGSEVKAPKGKKKIQNKALNGIRESKQKAEKVLEKTPKTTKIGHRTNEVAKNGIKENIVDQNPSKEKKTHIISSGKINKNINSNISKIKKNKVKVGKQKNKHKIINQKLKFNPRKGNSS